MYKPPENMNRVKAMRSKFESKGATSSVTSNAVKCELEVNSTPTLKCTPSSKSTLYAKSTPTAKNVHATKNIPTAKSIPTARAAFIAGSNTSGRDFNGASNPSVRCVPATRSAAAGKSVPSRSTSALRSTSATRNTSASRSTSETRSTSATGSPSPTGSTSTTGNTFATRSAYIASSNSSRNMLSEKSMLPVNNTPLVSPPRSATNISPVKSAHSSNNSLVDMSLSAKTDSSNTTPDRTHVALNRQYSDPVKRNIKRTPAFRLDKSNIPFQENGFSPSNSRNRYVDNKIKLFDTRLKETNCDNEENNCNNSNVDRVDVTSRMNVTSGTDLNSKTKLNSIPNTSRHLNGNMRVDTLESGNVKALRNKFSNDLRHQNVDMSSNDASTDDENLTSEIRLLYAKPIPKSLRTKFDSCSKDSDTETSIHEIESNMYENEPNFYETKHNIHETSTLKVSDKPQKEQSPDVARKYKNLFMKDLFYDKNTTGSEQSNNLKADENASWYLVDDILEYNKIENNHKTENKHVEANNRRPDNDRRTENNLLNNSKLNTNNKPGNKHLANNSRKPVNNDKPDSYCIPETNRNTQQNNLNTKLLKENLPNLTNLNINDSNVSRRNAFSKLKQNESNGIPPCRTPSPFSLSIESKLSTLERHLQATGITHLHTSGITDTIKRALTKPLPAGPAPKKPPRTFLHSAKEDLSPESKESPSLEKNISHLHLGKVFKKKLNTSLKKSLDMQNEAGSSRSRTNSKSKDDSSGQSEPNSSNTTPKSKSDPKYMLDKLENALRGNRIRLKRQAKADTSEEECEEEKSDSLKKKSLTNLYTASPSSANANSQKFNLNCLTSSFDCTKTNSVYEKIKEPNSCFFIGEKTAEPVYAIPFEFPVDVGKESEESLPEPEMDNGKSVRNSLYYLSSPVLNVGSSQIEDSGGGEKKKSDNKILPNNEVSSTSTSSDTESAASTPSEEIKRLVPRGNIRDIIKAFENATTPTNVNEHSQSPLHSENSISSTFTENPKTETSKCNNFDSNHSTNKLSTLPLNTDVRLQVLEEQIRKSLDRSFKNKNDVKMGSSSETDNSGEPKTSLKLRKKDEIVDRFETYVRTVRIFSDSDKGCDDKHLFTCLLLVGLMGKTPYIKVKYPKNVDIPHKIEDLCFPDAVGGPMDDSNAAQTYSLVITKESGDRIYGYCRRVMPEGSTHCLPLVYCILSKHRAPRFYRKILEHIESRHGLPDKVRDLLLHEFYHKCFPNPGHLVKFDLSKVKACIDMNEEKNWAKQQNCDNSVNNNFLKVENVNVNERSSTNSDNLDLNSFVVVGRSGEYGTLNKMKNNSLRAPGNTYGVEAADLQLRKSSSSPTIYDEQDDPSEISLRLHQDIRYEETDLEKFCYAMNHSILKKVFASLLLERKVILVSCKLSLLSSCIEALQSILYPFSWPHTLVPVLPATLWEIVEAPTPLICGCLQVAVVNDYKIENAIVVDLDAGLILQDVGDEDKILPSCMVKTWEKAMSIAHHIPRDETAHNVFLGDAFLRVFIDSCGHYKKFINNGQFQKEGFLAHPTLKGRKRFLKWFTETTMFFMFIDSVCSNTSSFPIFDKRIQIYSSPESDAILEKMKGWK